MRIDSNYSNYPNIDIEKLQSDKVKSQSIDNDSSPIKDEYISSEKSEYKPSGLYSVKKDENGITKIIYDDPQKIDKKLEVSKVEECTTNTDVVDSEIEKLKEQKSQLQQQIQLEKDEEKKQQLEKRLNEVEAELTKKNNDTYRRQNADIS